MIEEATNGKESFSGKRVAISGSGNVAQYAALKAIELGATVISLSDSVGSIVAEKGISEDLINEIADLKLKRKQLSILGDKSGIKYIEGARPWAQVGKVDIALPCATQNEVSGDEAKALIDAGCKFIAEGSNMGSTQEAIDVYEAHRKENGASGIWYGPGMLFSDIPQHLIISLTIKQAKPPTAEVSPYPVSRWHRTPSVYRGHARRSTTSSRTL